jgi:hypothetical protein
MDRPPPLEHCWRFVISVDHNAERPYHAAELLEKVREYIETCHLPGEPKPRFLVRDIVFDMYLGTATIYLRKNQ